MRGIEITPASLIVLLILALLAALIGFFFHMRNRGPHVDEQGVKKRRKQIPNILLFDLNEGYYYPTTLDVNTELNEAGWEKDDIKNLRQWIYKNYLVYALIKDGEGYRRVDIPKTLKQPPERVYRHLECKEASVCFAIPMSMLGKVNIGLFIAFGICALFIVYLLVAG